MLVTRWEIASADRTNPEAGVQLRCSWTCARTRYRAPGGGRTRPRAG
ncbi:hypothetical protein OG263_08330 [Streptomyces canus]|nr:hypothetical protein [Streptomyces canus]MCX4853792.1 hypothetical protein [Streptomyces canus]